LGDAAAEGADEFDPRPAAVLFGRNREPRPDRSRRAPLALDKMPVELGDAVELADDVLLWWAVWPKSRKQPASGSKHSPRSTRSNLTRRIGRPGVRQ
jgi:hypothetical protein